MSKRHKERRKLRNCTNKTGEYIYYCTAQIATYMKFNMEAFNMQSAMSIEDVNGKLFKLELGPQLSQDTYNVTHTRARRDAHSQGWVLISK